MEFLATPLGLNLQNLHRHLYMRAHLWDKSLTDTETHSINIFVKNYHFLTIKQCKMIIGLSDTF